jgi:hypothetical protein
MIGSGPDGEDGVLRGGINVAIVRERPVRHKGVHSSAMIVLAVPGIDRQEQELAFCGVRKDRRNTHRMAIERKQIESGASGEGWHG